MINQGRHAEAKDILNPLLTKNPKDANALNGMGWCLLTEGDLDGAKPYFERAIAADPDAAGAMNGLARVLSAKGDTDGAIKIWKEMVDKIPASARRHSRPGRCLFRERRIRQGAAALGEVGRRRPAE